MKINDLKDKIDKTVELLRYGRDRLAENLAATDETQRLLKERIDFRDKLDRDLVALETASPVDLERRGLSPVQATKAANELRAQLSPVTAEVEQLNGKLQDLRASIREDSVLLPRALLDFHHECQRYLRGQVASTLQTWVNRTQNDILHDLDRGRFDGLFPVTTAALILRDRIRRSDRIKLVTDTTAELLSVLDDVLKEPVPKLARHDSSIGFDERGFLTNA